MLRHALATPCLLLLSSVAAAQGILEPDDYVPIANALVTGVGSGSILVDTTEITMTLGDGTVYSGVATPDGRAVFCFGSIDLYGDPADPGGIQLEVGGKRPFALLARESFVLAIPLLAEGEHAGGAMGGRGGPGGGDGGDLGQPGRGWFTQKGLSGNSGGGGGSFADGADGGGLSEGAGGDGVGSISLTTADFPIAGAGGGGSNVGAGGGGGGYVELAAGCSLRLLSTFGGAGTVLVRGGNGSEQGGGGGGGTCILNAPTVEVRIPVRASGGSSPLGEFGGGGGGGLILVRAESSLDSVDRTQLDFLTAFGGLGAGIAPPSRDGDDGLPFGFLPRAIDDCNENGIDDHCDVLAGGVSQDTDGDGIPDDCQAPASLNLNPADFVSLGSLIPLTDGHADTDAMTLSFVGGPIYSGVLSNGRCVFAFDDVDIAAGLTITASGFRPLSLLSQGDQVWAGRLDAEGGFFGGPDGRPGGFNGSDGGGPGHGEGSDIGGAGAGHHGRGGDSGGGVFAPEGGDDYGGFGALSGGSGGGGAGGNRRGGGGGGAVELGALGRVTLEVSGELSCSGGHGELAAGGGSGGMLLLHATCVEIEGEVNVRGGDGGDDVGSTFVAGGGGGGGRIVIDADVASFDPVDFLRRGGRGGMSTADPFQAGRDGGDGDFLVWPSASSDCNENGVPDKIDLDRGDSADADLDGVPDECGTGISFCSGNPSAPFDCMPHPCGNFGVSHFAGCLNSAGTSAQLIAAGLPRASLDTLRFEMRRASPSTFAVLVSGAQRAPANAANPCFGLGLGIQSPVSNGLRCVVQGVLRHGTRAIDANGDVGVTTNGWGPPNGPSGGLIAASAFQPGQTRHFQIFYRDLPFAGCSETQNTTQGFTVTIEP